MVSLADLFLLGLDELLACSTPFASESFMILDILGSLSRSEGQHFKNFFGVIK